jgi:hypothetical protein
MVTIERASEVFVHGFAFTRSFTRPCVAAPVVPGVWVVRVRAAEEHHRRCDRSTYTGRSWTARGGGLLWREVVQVVIAG